MPQGAQKINIKYQGGSETLQTSYRGSQTLQTSLDSTLHGPALNNPSRSYAQVQSSQNVFPLLRLASSTPLKTSIISSQPDIRQVQKLGSRDLTFSSSSSAQSTLQNTKIRASTYQNPDAKGASRSAPHKGKAIKKELRRGERLSKDLDASTSSTLQNTQPVKKPKNLPLPKPWKRGSRRNGKDKAPSSVRAKLKRLMKKRQQLRARTGRSPLVSTSRTQMERMAMQEALMANRNDFFQPNQPWNQGFRPDFSPASRSFLSKAATGMTNFFTYGGRGSYLGKWSMNFLSSLGTMALAGIVQLAYTNSIWGPRAEVATQALVENANTLPWTIVRHWNTKRPTLYQETQTPRTAQPKTVR